MTVKDVTMTTLKMMGYVNNFGMVDENKNSKYFRLAPSFLNLIQQEIARAEGIAAPAELHSTTDIISVSESSASTAAPAALAMYFAQMEQDNVAYSFWAQQYYNNLLPYIGTIQGAIENVYGEGE